MIYTARKPTCNPLFIFGTFARARQSYKFKAAIVTLLNFTIKIIIAKVDIITVIDRIPINVVKLGFKIKSIFFREKVRSAFGL